MPSPDVKRSKGGLSSDCVGLSPLHFGYPIDVLGVRLLYFGCPLHQMSSKTSDSSNCRNLIQMSILLSTISTCYYLNLFLPVVNFGSSKLASVGLISPSCHNWSGLKIDSNIITKYQSKTFRSAGDLWSCCLGLSLPHLSYPICLLVWDFYASVILLQLIPEPPEKQLFRKTLIQMSDTVMQLFWQSGSPQVPTLYLAIVLLSATSPAAFPEAFYYLNLS